CWVSTLQPYLKSGQILFCPSFDPKRTAYAVDREACDGDDSPGSGSQGFVPPAAYLSHYGIAVPLTFGSCAHEDAYARFPGSGWTNAYYPGLASGAPAFRADSVATIVDSSRTIIAADGLTVVRSDAPAVGTLLGCEG